jgi:hypothetical protein
MVMGSFLSSFSSTSPSPDDLELQTLSPSADRTSDPDPYSKRHHPLNPIGHFTSNLLIVSFRRRRTYTNTQTQVQALESSTVANRANDPEPGPGASTLTDSDGITGGDVSAVMHDMSAL